MKKEEIEKTLALHKLYLCGKGGKRADLHGADLRCANLSGAITDESTKLPPIVCPKTGSFIAYKKASRYPNSVIVVLEVLADAKRSSAATKKCRCSKAKVLGFETLLGEEIKEDIFVRSNYDETFLYKKGEIVEVKDFDDNRWEECAAGIHFFMSKQAAIDY